MHCVYVSRFKLLCLWKLCAACSRLVHACIHVADTECWTVMHKRCKELQVQTMYKYSSRSPVYLSIHLTTDPNPNPRIFFCLFSSFYILFFVLYVHLSTYVLTYKYVWIIYTVGRQCCKCLVVIVGGGGGRGTHRRRRRRSRGH